MNNINKYILMLVMAGIWGAALCLKAEADSSLQMVVVQNELKGMIANKDASSKPVHHEWESRNPFETNMQNGNTMPLATPRRNLILQGIFLGSKKPSAIISNKVIGIGDVIQGVTLQEIKEDSVVLIDGEGNEITLSLKQ